MRANGYKVKPGTRLDQQIDSAAEDQVITKARSLRAHEDIRVLGNDVLHEEWREIGQEEVAVSQHYCQRILEDFYGDRSTVETQLKSAKRDFEPIAPAAAEASATTKARMMSVAPRPITPV